LQPNLDAALMGEGNYDYDCLHDYEPAVHSLVGGHLFLPDSSEVNASVVYVAGSGGKWFFFFFQAEDGIRVRTVTGVQTCALPIWSWCASTTVISSRVNAYMAIHAVPSLCSSAPVTGSAAERSNGSMLSRPRKPPSKTLFPSTSLRLTHQVKLMSSFCSTRARKPKSAEPSSSKTRTAAQACTGGLTSSKAHSYAGSWPFGCMYHSRQNSKSCSLANSVSTNDMATMWNARSQAAYHGYSHSSGIEMMSAL